MPLTYTSQMQRIASDYRAAGQTWPAAAREIASWAIRNKLWLPPHSALVAQCADDLARALREEYLVDPQGRTVRAKHAARVEQKTLWDDIRTAPREHMDIALRQRRQQIVGDCRQLKADVDSFNDNHSRNHPIQMSFNFTNDLLELEAAAAA